MPFPLFNKVNKCPDVPPHANTVKEQEEEPTEKHDRSAAHADETSREEENWRHREQQPKREQHVHQRLSIDECQATSRDDVTLPWLEAL